MPKKNTLLSAYIVILFLFMSFQIAHSETIDSNDLFLYIESPEEVIETHIFIVTILANETPIKDVKVILRKGNSWQFKNIEITDSNGKVQFTAPSIIYGSTNRIYSILAMKVGYITNEKNITVINVPNLLIREEIKSKYNKNEIIAITIIDNSSKPIANATIQFEDNTYYSDDNGKVTLTMPPYNGEYKLKITKEGYANHLVIISVYEPYLSPGPMMGFICLLSIVVFIIILVVVLIYKKYLHPRK